MNKSNSRRYAVLIGSILSFIIFMIIMYQSGVLSARSKYVDYTEDQYFQFLLTQKSFVSLLISQLQAEHGEDVLDVKSIISQTIEPEFERSDIHAQFAILDQDGLFLYHPVYSGHTLDYIENNYDASAYKIISESYEGILETPPNSYKPDLVQVIYHTTIEDLGWSLMLIEDRTAFNDIERFRRLFFNISATILTILFGLLGYAYYRNIVLLNKTQDMNMNLESLVQDRTISVLTNNRELEYALKDAEKSKERMIQSNEELNTMIHQIQETQEKLIESEKMASLGSIVAGVAHEINTPLGTALTSATYIAELVKEAETDFKNNELTKRKFATLLGDLKDSVQLLTDSLFRTSQLVLSFKQIAVDQSDTQKLYFDLCDYINKIVLSLKHEYKNTPHSIKVHCTGKIEIESYPGAFAQIFTNLIMNSLIHGFDGVIEGTITIDIKRINSNLFIIYSDTGKGIPKSDIKRIFEPFFTTKRGSGGSGLGMNIVYNLVTQKLDGTIQVKSERNIGVKFIIQMPV